MSVAQKEILLKELDLIPDEFLDDVVKLLRGFTKMPSDTFSKMKAMQIAANDPLYLQDLQEVQGDTEVVYK